MKNLRHFMALLICVCSVFTALASDKADIKGSVKDALTGEPIAGATIYISDLKLASNTGADGTFLLRNVPAKGKFLVEARFLGYKTASQLVDLATSTEISFSLSPSVIESQEVVITGTPFSSNNKTNSLAVVTVNREQLTEAGGTNLVDAIARIPGVSQIATGGAISKPVIRGLGYNRVLTIAEGAREEGQQWGDEHGMQFDQFSAARVEILKGPASLLYGSDALGGVINIIDDLVPAPGEVRGGFTTAYNTNNGLTASSLMLQGNNDGFVYRGRASYKNAFGFGYKGMNVPNSGFNEMNGSAMLGLNKSWGYTHLNISSFNTQIGLVEEGPDASGTYFDEDDNVIDRASARSRDIGLPFQRINHFRTTLSSNILLGGGQLKSVFGFQNNIRREFEESADAAGLNLSLNSYTYDVKYSLPGANGWEPTFGLQGMYQNNANRGDEFLIPDYNSHNIGVFGYLKKNFEGGAVNAGLRYDYKTINGDELVDGGATVFNGFKNSFSNVSGSIGLAYELAPEFIFKANAGSGFRAPNIAELGSNGKHEGTFRYEIGNSNLKQETSLQFDAGLEYDGKAISLGLNVYSNRINNYIYPGNFNNETIPYTDEDGNVDILPVFRYAQTDAILVGGEASVDFHFIKDVHFENSFSYVKGTNKANNGPLPFIPAATIINELRFEPEIKGLASSYIKVGLTNVLDQNRADIFETATAGYTLLDAGVGAGIKTKRGKINVWVTGQNLTNKLY
ncbi:MAG: TonB-dependent receptor, partial [Sphingobacteriales bacterium]